MVFTLGVNYRESIRVKVKKKYREPRDRRYWYPQCDIYIQLYIEVKESQRVLFVTQKFKCLVHQEKGQINLIEVFTTSGCLIL